MTDSVPNLHSVTVTSTAMISSTPPPAMLPTHQHQQQQQHMALIHQLMTTQLAAQFLQQQHQHQPGAVLATSSAMVASTPPPAVMTAAGSTLPGQRAKAAAAAATQPAVSWQQVHVPPPATLAHEGPGLCRDAPLPRGDAPIGTGAGGTSGTGCFPTVAVKVEEDQSQDQAPEGGTEDRSTAAAVLPSFSGPAAAPVPSGFVQVLLDQQQQIAGLKNFIQQLVGSGGGRVPATEATMSAPANGASTSQQPKQEQHPCGSVAPAAIPASAAVGYYGGTPAVAGPGSAPATSPDTALATMLASGGSEALQHLLTLGVGTMMAAAALRQQQGGGGGGGGVSAENLAAAQLHVAAQPSTQAILTSLLGTTAVAGTAGGDLQRQQQQQASRLGRSSSGSSSLGGDASSSGVEGLLLGGGGMGGLHGLGTPMGSMMDLVDLLSGSMGGGGAGALLAQPLPSPTNPGAALMPVSPNGNLQMQGLHCCHGSSSFLDFNFV